MKLFSSVFNVHTTTKCTLRCKLCSGAFPQFKPIDEDTNLVISEIDEAFKIYEFIDEFRIMGAEVFLHKDICKIVNHVSLFREQFGKILLITNGTYLLKREILESLKNLSCKYLIRVDDYGAVSTRVHELIDQLNEEGIVFEVRNYNEDEQFCGGWIDMDTSFAYKNYNADEVADVFERCYQKTACKIAWNGKIFGCGFIASGTMLGKIPDSKSDYVELFTGMSIEEKRDAISRLGMLPFEGCKYCKGYDPNETVRYKAAEQLP